MWREILGLKEKPSNLVEVETPRRSFADVILPEPTRRQLYEALTQIEKHQLIFSQWGLGERHPTGLGLAFNFAGPPGTGKTICAEAVARALGRKLLRVRYAELESCWAGETGKNIRAVFREARTLGAVLFFDEADSIAARRFSNVQIGYEREANQAVNILLKELEEHEGVVIFATNMASNFDPAFERRIRTHILFRPPNAEEREKIWGVQVHPGKTPLADDVDFTALAERFPVTGGDIRNAVLKAAQMAAAEEGEDEAKRLHQRHFIQAMEEVLEAKSVMQQNAIDPQAALFPWQEAMEAVERRFETVDEDVQACRTELELLGQNQTTLGGRLDAQHGELQALGDLLRGELEAMRRRQEDLETGLSGLREELAQLTETQTRSLQTQEGSLHALVARLEAQESRLENATLLRWSPKVTAAIGAGLALLGGVVGTLAGSFFF